MLNNLKKFYFVHTFQTCKRLNFSIFLSILISVSLYLSVSVHKIFQKLNYKHISQLFFQSYEAYVRVCQCLSLSVLVCPCQSIRNSINQSKLIEQEKIEFLVENANKIGYKLFMIAIKGSFI